MSQRELALVGVLLIFLSPVVFAFQPPPAWVLSAKCSIEAGETCNGYAPGCSAVNGVCARCDTDGTITRYRRSTPGWKCGYDDLNGGTYIPCADRLTGTCVDNMPVSPFLCVITNPFAGKCQLLLCVGSQQEVPPEE